MSLAGLLGGRREVKATKYQVLEQTFVLTVSIPANQPVNSTLIAKITTDPRYDPVTTLRVPKGETWFIDDIYVTGSQPVDGILRVIKNERQVVHITSPVNSLLVSNPSRPVSKLPEPFDEFSTITAEFINLSSPAAAQTNTIYMKVKRIVPVG
jgi:hypothetical protein